MNPQGWRWNWGSFLVYSIACFFVGLVAGLIEIPGIFPVVLGAGAGACAARWRWFEVADG